MKIGKTRTEMIEAILQDMKNKRPNEDPKKIDKQWKGWLNRQDKATLEPIYAARILGIYNIAAGI